MFQDSGIWEVRMDWDETRMWETKNRKNVDGKNFWKTFT
jgi:hypothetical protein